jgi:hypothetical protein
VKTEAISNLERAHIIQQLAHHGKWKAERMGATVEMARFRTLTDGRRVYSTSASLVYYSVTLAGHLVVSARADTVGQAVDDVNKIIHGHAPQLTARVAQSARAV